VHILWVTVRRFGRELCQTTQIDGARALIDRGHKITFLGPESEPPIGLEDIEFHGVQFSRIPGLQSLSLERGVGRGLHKLLKENEFDAVITGWGLARPVHSQLGSGGLPWVVIDRSTPVFGGLIGRLQWLHYHAAWKKGRMADGAAIKSEHLRLHLANLGVLPNEVVIMPAGVDVQRFSTDGSPTPPPLRLVYHGRMDRNRDLLSIVNACDILVNQGHHLDLRMFGRGDLMAELRRMASNREWLEVTGPHPREEVPQLLADRHVGLLPLPDTEVWNHASPLKVFEYAASGLCVVATDIECHRVLGERPWLELTDPSDPIGGIVGALEGLLRSKDIEMRGLAARSDAESEFTWERAVEGLDDLLHSLIQAQECNSAVESKKFR